MKEKTLFKNTFTEQKTRVFQDTSLGASVRHPLEVSFNDNDNATVFEV